MPAMKAAAKKRRDLEGEAAIRPGIAPGSYHGVEKFGKRVKKIKEKRQK
jgi:hypothetical protein